MRRAKVILLLAALLSGCAYVAPPSGPTADFYLLVKSSSSAWRYAIGLWAFKDTECNESEYGGDLGDARGRSRTLMTAPRKILAERSLAFTAVYGEHSPADFGFPDRTCIATAEFLPRADHHYEASLSLSGDGSICDLRIYDLTAGDRVPVDFKMPAWACGPPSGKSGKNCRCYSGSIFRPIEEDASK
jgi:hypothetical protein